MDKVSVIVPIYNVDKYLDRCLNNIINQTYKNIEIILINDASTDKSFSICKKFLKKDKRIILINNKENKGVAEVRNIGINAATGEYITFIDSDDYADLDYVETLYNLIKEDDYDISVCGYTIIENNSIKDIKTGNNKYSLSQKEAIKKILLNDDFIISLWSKMYKRNLFNNKSFPKNKVYEDVLMQSEIFLSAKKIIYSEVSKYYYCIRLNSVSFSHYSQKDLDRCEFSKLFAKKVIKKYPELITYARLFYINNLIATCNKQFLSKIFKSQEIRTTKDLIKKYLFDLMHMDISYGKKFQYLLFLINVKFYIWFYKKIKNSVLTKGEA